MGTPLESPYGPLTDEEKEELIQELGPTVEPKAPVEPEPELFIEPDPLPPESAPEPAPEEVPMAPAITPLAMEQGPHEQLVQGVLDTVAQIWRARTKREPDWKYLNDMRGIYNGLRDEQLRVKTVQLLEELRNVQAK